MKKIALVCCYGLYIPERISSEREGLEQYYSTVASELTAYIQSGELAAIVLCGGYTIPGMGSESETTRDLFFRYLGEESEKVDIILENTSLTTPENLAFGYLTARKYEPEGIICCCDEYRTYKVQVEATELFSDRFELTYITAPRKDTHPNSNIEFQNTKALSRELQEGDFETLKVLVRNR